MTRVCDFTRNPDPLGTGTGHSKPLVTCVGLKNRCHLPFSPTAVYTASLICLFSVVLSPEAGFRDPTRAVGNGVGQTFGMGPALPPPAPARPAGGCSAGNDT